MTKRLRVVSGMRPTGPLHLGHLKGVLENWLRLQDEHECFFFIADWHALTTEYADPGIVRAATLEVALDWLAVGIDPARALVFVQSEVPAHAELHLLLSFITPLSWLERVPSYKDQIRELREKDLGTYGFLGYPLLQTADVLVHRGEAVPVGEDQLPHIELAREIARRFNHLYGETFPEPQALLAKATKLPGLDGRKMSKSFKNTIPLAEDWKTTERKVRTMPTDPARVRRTDPGTPEKCPVWRFHEVYATEEEKAGIRKGCTTAGIGCLDCKRILLRHLEEELAPIRARRARWQERPDEVREILHEGSRRARELAAPVLDEARARMGIPRELA